MSEIKIAMPEMGNSLFRKYMKSKYAESLVRAGAKVVWIPLEDAVQAVSMACACDGLLLPGGADIAPSLYNQAPTDKCGKPNGTRDRAEPQIFTAFLKTGKPILGICRGFQMVNVLCGGTLHQDIKEMQTCRHMDFFSRTRDTHTVTLEKDTKLYEIFNADTIRVNSMHHQAVDLVGEGLVTAAKSEDGFVEAVERADHPFCVCVQWHPEHMSRKSAAQQRLFQAFVRACEAQKGRNCGA